MYRVFPFIVFMLGAAIYISFAIGWQQPTEGCAFSWAQWAEVCD